MRRRSNTAVMEWTAIIGVICSAGLLVFNLVAYSAERERMPAGMIIAEVPVGHLTPAEAQAELARVYSTPLELHYRDSIFGLNPAQISFRLDTEVMLARADTYRTESSFWTGFWNYLWSQPGRAVKVDLSAEYSPEQLRQFLLDIASRYDSPPTAGQGDSVALTFNNGQPGYSLDVDSSVTVVNFALRQPTNRRVALTIVEDTTARPTMTQLESVVKAYLQDKQFNGIASIVVIDPKSGQELNLNGEVAFTGMSVMKIPIVTMTYWKWDTDPPEELITNISEALLESSNFNANLLLRNIGDESELRGAELLTQNMNALGLKNTFMAKAFDQETPADPILTPANQRTDFNTDPDPYIQTTAGDMASLLLMIHECASTGGGPLAAVFPGRFTQGECQTILSFLAQNQTGVQIDGGVPEGIKVAHKEGLSDNAYGDAGVVFSPATDYIIVEYIWTPDYLNWEYGQPIMADISRAVYNYFNEPVNGQ